MGIGAVIGRGIGAGIRIRIGLSLPSVLAVQVGTWTGMVTEMRLHGRAKLVSDSADHLSGTRVTAESTCVLVVRNMQHRSGSGLGQGQKPGHGQNQGQGYSQDHSQDQGR